MQDLEHILHQTGSLWEDVRGKSVFLTGGTGFVGTWLVESLLWANDRLGLDINAVMLTRDAARFRLRAPHIVEHPQVRLLQGDASDFPFPEGEFTFVIHAATGHYHEPDTDHPLAAFDDDVNGTRHVLEFARAHGARRFLFTSSGAVYGQQPPEMNHIGEQYAGAPATTDPGAGYGQAKRVSEFMSCMFGRVYGFDVLIGRLFAFAGPLLPLHLNFAIGNFIRDALGGGPLRVAGDGTPYRSYLYAADLAVWLWTILLRGKTAHPYNVGSPHALTIAELARMVVRTVAPGISIEIAGHAAPGSLPSRYVPCTLRAQEELGLRPQIAVEEGIRRMAAWYRQKPSE
jgi:dTDP-glucose 4,6-dehydratase